MGVLSSILSLPLAPVLAPVRGVIWIGEVIQDQVEQQLHDPVILRRELEEIERAEAAGDLSADEAGQAQQAVLERMMGPRGGGR